MTLPTTLAALGACAMLAAAPAWAAPHLQPTSLGAHMRSPHPPAAKGVVRTVLGVMESAAADLDRPLNSAAETDTDSNTSFNCKADGGCTVIAETMVALHSLVADNNWSMCVYVDDVRVSNTCLLQGAMGEETFHAGTARASVTVAKGKHLIRTTVYADGDGLLSAYEHSYMITTP
jgi:hypothetical protein